MNLPLNTNIGLTVEALRTRTTVEFDAALREDVFTLNGAPQKGKGLARVTRHLDHIRKAVGNSARARVASENAFSADAGLASSASAFAALTVAAFEALGVRKTPEEASTYARLGSGSAARSVLGGFVEWKAGTTHEASRAVELAPPSHWDVHDVVLVFSGAEKKVGSSEGHPLAKTSPMNDARLAEVEKLLPVVRKAIRERDVAGMARATELDALLMHAVMMTSDPSLVYWTPETVAGIHAVRQWREEGVPAFFTIDAGPNVHVFAAGAAAAREVAQRAERELGLAPGDVIASGPGAGARVLREHLF